MSSAKQQARFLAQLARQPWQAMEPVPGAAETMRSLATAPGLQAIHSGWRNNLYAVWVSTEQTAWGPVDHLWVRRHDGEPVRSWSDMQRIKREVLYTGAERTAVEVYPPEAEIVDQANMYHLWVLPGAFRLPFGLKKGATS